MLDYYLFCPIFQQKLALYARGPQLSVDLNEVKAHVFYTLSLIVLFSRMMTMHKNPVFLLRNKCNLWVF